MHSFTAFAAMLALATSTMAQDPNFDSIFKPSKEEKITAGTTYTIQWTVPAGAQSGPVTIKLIGGSDDMHLEPVADLAKGYDNSKGKFDWAVDKSLGDKAFYGLSITLESNQTAYQYSPRFHITGGSTSSSTSSASSTTTTVVTTGTSTTTSTTSATPTTSDSSTAAPTTSSTVTSSSSTNAPSSTTKSGNAGTLPTARPIGVIGGLALAAAAML